jgi:hypothetical protein
MGRQPVTHYFLVGLDVLRFLGTGLVALSGRTACPYQGSIVMTVGSAQFLRFLGDLETAGG